MGSPTLGCPLHDLLKPCSLHLCRELQEWCDILIK
jgi:hypothetical protein